MKRLKHNPLLFISVIGFASILISYLFTWIILLIEYIFNIHFDKTGTGYLSPWLKIFGACIFGPLIETYFFQKLIYDYFTRESKSRFWMIVVSSTLFGLTHLYSPVYAIGAGLIGVVLIYAYIIWDETNKISKFLIVTLIHSFYNIFFLSMEAILIR